MEPVQLPLNRAVDAIELYDNGLDQNLDNLDLMRTDIGKVLDNLAAYDRAVEKIVGLQQELKSFGDDIGKLRLVVNLMGKAGALKTVANTADKLLKTVEDKVDRFEEKVRDVVKKLQDNPVKDALDRTTDKLEDFDERLAKIEGEIGAQKTAFGNLVDILDQASDYSQQPIRWTGTLVEPPALLLQEIDMAFDDAYGLLDVFRRDVPSQPFDNVIRIDQAIGKVLESLDWISRPLNEVYKVLKPIEPILAAVDTISRLTIDPVIDFVQKTIGIDAIINEANKRIDALLPSISFLDNLEAAYDRATAKIVEFDISTRTWRGEDDNGNQVTVPDPFGAVEWIEDSLKQKLMETVIDGSKQLVASAGLSAGGFGIGIEIPKHLPGQDTSEPPLRGSDDDDELVAFIDDVILIGDQNDNRIVAAGGDNVLMGGPGNDELIGVNFDASDRDGSDVLFGGTGNDTLRGGSGGEDVALFLGALRQYTVSQETEDSPVIIEMQSPIPGVSLEGRDELHDIEFLEFSDFRVSVEDLLENSTTNAPGSTFTPGPQTPNPDGSFDPLFLFVSGTGSRVQPPGVDVTAGRGDDVVSGGQGDDTLRGGSGDDTFSLGGFFGSDLNRFGQTVFRGSGEDTIFGGPGTDTFSYFEDLDGQIITMDMRLETQQFQTRSATVTFQGIQNFTTNDDSNAYLFGDGANNVLTGGDGIGRNGFGDLIDGRRGNDRIDGNGGNDILIGGLGIDSLFGGDGNDYLIVGDRAVTGRGQLYDGGDGNDFLDYSNDLGARNGSTGILDDPSVDDDSGSFSADTRAAEQVASGRIRLEVGTGIVERLSDNGQRVLAVDEVRDIEGFRGSNFDDTLIGTSSTDLLAGTNLDGGAGDDVIFARSSTGTITGGAGTDIIYAGTVLAGPAGGATYDGGANDILNLTDPKKVRWYVEQISQGGTGRVKPFLGTDDQDITSSSAPSAFGSGGISGFGVFRGGAFDDVFDLTRTFDTTVRGGDGDDSASFHVRGDRTFNDQHYTFEGGKGNDFARLNYAGTLDGGSGDDTLQVESFVSETNETTALGGTGSDEIIVRSGSGFLGGGRGTDILAAGRGLSDGFRVNMLEGTLTGRGTDRLNFDIAGFETVIGSDDENDTLLGGLGDDRLIGGGGNDLISGLAGAELERDLRSFTQVSGPNLPDFEDSWAVQVVFVLPEQGTDLQRLVTKPVGGGQTFSLLLNSSVDQTRFDKVGGGVEAISLTQLYSVFDPGDTVELTGSFDADAQTLTSRITGVGSETRSVDPSDPITTSGDIFIGRFSETISQTFDGDILEVRVWSDVNVSGGAPRRNDPSLELNLFFEDGVPTDRATKGHTVTYFDLADADLLYGGDGNDSIFGGDGDDLLHGGIGNNLLVGGFGTDVASYASAAPGTDSGALESSGIARVLANLETGQTTIVRSAGGNNTDTLIDIENLEGSSGDDVLTGDGGDNGLRGGEGADIMFGLGGDDLISIEGNDTAEGGNGSDTFAIGSGFATINGGDENATGRGDALDFTGVDAEGGVARYYLKTNTYVIDVFEDVPVWAPNEGDAPNEDYTAARTINGVTLTPQQVFESDPTFANSSDDFSRVVPDEDRFSITFERQIVRTESSFQGIESFIGGVRTDQFFTTGSDSVVGGLTDDRMAAKSGNDTVDGRFGDDTLLGEDGSDLLRGGQGNDQMSGGAQADTIRGGTGNDRVDAGLGADLVFLDRGNDMFTDNDQNDTFGRDTVFGGSGQDTINGGGGNDEFHGNEGNDSILGRRGNDKLFGGDQNDTIRAGDGRDTVSGGNGNDLVFLEAGNDVFNDTVQNDAFGRDTVLGGDGADTINGGGGNDEFRGGAGRDSILGGNGNDNIFGGDQNDTIRAGNGNDTVRGDNGADLVFLGDGNDLFVDANQSSAFGGDEVFGGLGADTMNGRGGDDIFHGQQGNDVLRGGLGEDRLLGGTGNDTLTGGSDADVFVFARAGGQDVVVDFVTGIDELAIAANAVGGRNAAQVVNDFASVTARGVLLDFETGQTVLLQGLTNLNGLASDIDIF